MADLGLVLPLGRGAKGYFNTTADILTQMRANITNLLLTRKGTRPFQPEFGSDLHSLVFQQMTDDGLANVQGAIESAVAQWMPFLTINNVEVQYEIDAYRVYVRITFSLSTDKSILDNVTLVF